MAEIATTDGRGWALIVCVFFTALLLAGGISGASGWQFIFNTALSAAILAISFWRLRNGFPTSYARVGAFIATACLTYVVLQLVPMPPSIWTNLPGRAFVLKSLELSALQPEWMPISLSPENTRIAALAILPGIAAYFAVLSVPSQQLRLIALCISLLALACVFLALAQRTQGIESVFHLYKPTVPAATGTFGNRNFFASQLFTSIPMIAALAMAASTNQRLPGWVIALFTAIYAAMLVAGLAIIGSRAGILLAMISLIASAFLYRGRAATVRRSSTTQFIFLALVLGLLVLSQAGMLGILRLAQTDQVSDVRSVINTVSTQIITAYFPIGSGFGTFVPVYQLFETPAVIFDNYVNHAHNDWYELVIEGGLGSIILMSCFLIWLCVGTVRAWRFKAGDYQSHFERAAGIAILLLLLHSMVDYPLRTPALLTLFGLCCGMLAAKTPKVTKKARPQTQMPVRRATARKKPFQMSETDPTSSGTVKIQ